MTNSYIDKIIRNPKNKSEKKFCTLSDLPIIIVFIIIASFIAWILGFDFFGLLPPSGKKVKLACIRMQRDADNTFGAIASYWSHPDKMDEVPTFQDLVESQGLTIDKNSTVTIDGPYEQLMVTVIDKKGICPLGKKLVVHYGGSSVRWYSE